MSNEWIKINRNFLEWEWYDDLNTKVLFLHLLLKANTEDKQWHGIKVERGSFVTSLSTLSKEVGLTTMQVRTSLSKLETTQKITNKATKRYRIISICNFDSYQVSEGEDNKVSNKQITKQQQTNNKANNKQNNKATIFVEGSNTIDCNADEKGDNKVNNKVSNKQNNKDGKEEKKKENLSPTPPIKEINKRRNTPNGGLPTTTSSALNGGARKVFESFFNKTYGSAYYWSAKDAGHMTKLLKKIQFARNSRGLPIDDDSTLKALGLFLESIKDDWILQNFTVSVINSKYNEIVSQARQIGHGSNNRNDQRSLEQAQRQSEVVDLLSRLRAEDATDPG